MAKKTLEDRLAAIDADRLALIDKLVEKKAQERKAQERKERLEVERARKLDTRQKAILGGALLHLLKKDQGSLKSWVKTDVLPVVIARDKPIIQKLLEDLGVVFDSSSDVGISSAGSSPAEKVE